jgi:hypothetical protein
MKTKEIKKAIIKATKENKKSIEYQKGKKVFLLGKFALIEP